MEAVQVRPPPSKVPAQGKITFSIVERVRTRLSALPSPPSQILPEPPISTTSTTSSAVTSTSVSATTSATQGSDVNTVATSILIVPTIFTVHKVHVAPGMLIEGNILSIWEQSIKLRLRAILVQEVTTGTCGQEFMMAGRRPDRLRPTVVVTCGDMITKKRVEKVFKGLDWLQELLKANGILFVAAIQQVQLSSGPTLVSRATASATPSSATVALKIDPRRSIIVGSVVGGLALIAALILSAFYFLRRRKVSRNHLGNDSSAITAPPMEENPRNLWPVNQKLNRNSTTLPESGILGPKTWSIPSQPPFEAPPYHYAVRMPAPKTLPPVYTPNGKSVETEQDLTAGSAISNPFDACTLSKNENIITFCGERLFAWSVRGGSPKQCTLGGLVAVNNTVYAMTAGHVLKPSLETIIASTNHGSPSIHDMHGDSGHSSDASDEPFWFGDDDNDNDSDSRSFDNTSSSQNNVTPQLDSIEPMSSAREDPELEGSVVLPVVKHSHNTEREHVATMYDLPHTDWALLSVSKIGLLLPNLLVDASSSFDTPIIDINTTIAQGDVFVMVHGQSYPGTLRAATSTIQIHQMVCEVHMVILKENLPPGCSGSWVIADNKLCGHIIAIRQDVPWAYMVPAHALFADIKRAMGTDDVRLPTTSDVDSHNTQQHNL